jgi:F-type H+/Na+-transporting ATPase subunit alpha
MTTLAEDLRSWLGQSRQRIETLALAPRLKQVGHVAQIADGVATVVGLPDTRLDELLLFDGGVRGLAVDLGEQTIGCVLLGDTVGIRAGRPYTAPARSRACRLASLCSVVSSMRSGRRSTAA